MGWGKNEVFDFFSAGLNVFIPIPSQAGAIYPEPLVGALANFLIVNSHNHHRYREMMCVVLRHGGGGGGSSGGGSGGGSGDAISAGGDNEPAASGGGDAAGGDAWSALHQSAERGSTDCLVLLLAHGMDSRFADAHGRTPLMAALEACHVDAALALVPLSDVSAAGPLGRTALHCCAARGLASCAARLLDARASPTARDGRGRTPLHAAAEAGAIAVMAHLLAADGGKEALDARDADGCTPALLALQSARPAPLFAEGTAGGGGGGGGGGGHSPPMLLQAAGLCLSHRCDARAAAADGQTLLHHAAALGATDLLATLIAASADVSAIGGADGSAPLHLAAARGEAASARMLLAAGAAPAAPDGCGRTPLELCLGASVACAPHAGHAACHEILLRHLAR